MRRRATDASFEPLQGDSAPRRGYGFNAAAQDLDLSPWPQPPDEQGHDGWELRAPPDTSLQAADRPKTKGASLGSDRNDVWLRARLDEDDHDVSHCPLPPASPASKVARAESHSTKSARKGVENGGLGLAQSAAPPAVSHPHTNDRPPDLRRFGLKARIVEIAGVSISCAKEAGSVRWRGDGIGRIRE